LALELHQVRMQLDEILLVLVRVGPKIRSDRAGSLSDTILAPRSVLAAFAVEQDLEFDVA
jgi:hypothetical protein